MAKKKSRSRKIDNPVRDSIAAGGGMKGSGAARKQALTEQEVLDFVQKIVNVYETGEREFFQFSQKTRPSLPSARRRASTAAKHTSTTSVLSFTTRNAEASFCPRKSASLDPTPR